MFGIKLISRVTFGLSALASLVHAAPSPALTPLEARTGEQTPPAILSIVTQLQTNVNQIAANLVADDRAGKPINQYFELLIYVYPQSSTNIGLFEHQPSNTPLTSVHLQIAKVVSDTHNNLLNATNGLTQKTTETATSIGRLSVVKVAYLDRLNVWSPVCYNELIKLIKPNTQPPVCLQWSP